MFGSCHPPSPFSGEFTIALDNSMQFRYSKLTRRLFPLGGHMAKAKAKKKVAKKAKKAAKKSKPKAKSKARKGM